jgi:hypothetical protein
MRLLISVGLLFLLTAPGSAQAPTADDQALIRTMASEQFRAGLAAADESRWEEARQAFERTYELSANPLVLINLALAQRELRQLMAARASYRLFLDRVDATTDQAYVDQARQALAGLEPRIPVVRLLVSGMEPADQVEVDGVPIALGELREVSLDPGRHTARVLRGAREVASQGFALAEADRRDISLRIEGTVPPPAAGPTVHEDDDGPVILPQNATGEEDAGGDGKGVLSSPWFWTAAAVIVAGTVTGVVLATSGSEQSEPFLGNLPPGRWEVR